MGGATVEITWEKTTTHFVNCKKGTCPGHVTFMHQKYCY